MIRFAGALFVLSSAAFPALAQQRQLPAFDETVFRVEVVRASVNRQSTSKILTINAKIVNKIDVPIRAAIYEGNRFGIQFEDGDCNFNGTDGVTRTSTPPSCTTPRDTQDFVRISPQGSAGFTIRYWCRELSSSYVTLTVPIIVGEDASRDQQASFTVFSALLDDIRLPASAMR